MSRALIYSDSTKGNPVYGNVGDHRWECEWYVLSAAAQKRYDADPNYEHDHDRDEVTRIEVFKTKDEAIAQGKKVAPASVYGCAIVQEHVLCWWDDDERRVADWEATGPKFEVASDGEVAEI